MKSASVQIIGIDCAADPKNVGLGIGVYTEGKARLQLLAVGKNEDHLVKKVTDWMAGTSTVLLALDAPLAWPEQMGDLLAAHHAGEAIRVEANDFFRRMTDKRVKRHLNRQPLDVGADRIARTALAALTMLDALRKSTHVAVPLAWSTDDLA